MARETHAAKIARLAAAGTLDQYRARRRAQGRVYDAKRHAGRTRRPARDPDDFWWAQWLQPGENYQAMIARLEAAGTLEDYRTLHRRHQLNLLATNEEYGARQKAANRARIIQSHKHPTDAQRAAYALVRRRYYENLKADPVRYARHLQVMRESKARSRARRKAAKEI